MQTQITCPNCQTGFPTQLFQIVDAQRQPELKEMLLSGMLNVAVCQNCGNATQLATPLLYHDSDHDLMMVYVPMELNLPMPEQERLVGQLAKVITDNTPPEQFRGYMLQPQVILTLQTFMEKVYATEGITPEMLQRQRDQMQFLQSLITADSQTADSLIAEKIDLIDETLLSILSQSIQSAEQNPAPAANQQFIAMVNLQAKIFTQTDVGRKLERRQAALTRFQKEAQARGGLTSELFLDHLIANADDEATQAAIIQTGQQAIRYETFSMLTERIEAEADSERKQSMVRLHANMMQIFEEMQAQAKEMMDKAQDTLDILMYAQDLNVALERNAESINENFLYYLSAQIEQAEQTNDSKRESKLKQIHAAIMKQVEGQMPEELRILNQLMRTDDSNAQRQIIEQIPPQARPQFAQMIEAMTGEAGITPEMAERLMQIQTLMV